MATKKYNHEYFTATVGGQEIEFHCWTTSNRNGFCHYCYTERYGNSRCVYCNRTWERFRYESVLSEAIDKFPKRMRADLREQIIEGKYREAKAEAEAFLGEFQSAYEKLSDANKKILAKSPAIQTEEQAKGVLSVMHLMNAIDVIKG